jgi:hypothetical protein
MEHEFTPPLATFQMTAQIAPKGQARIGPGGMGKKTALAIVAEYRMAAIATVEMMSLPMVLFLDTLGFRVAPGVCGCAGSVRTPNSRK